jgi:long-chain acyl-CoA synthetase
VAEGETGEILLQGKGLMKGYWGRSVAEEESLRHEGFRTGDMGRLQKGSVELLGRLDDMMKVGGRKVNPQEVEMALNRHPSVAQSAVIGLSDPRGIFENELHAFVVVKDPGAGLSESEVLDHCRNVLEAYKVPKHVHFRASLPMSAVGKVLKKALEPELSVRVPS